MPSGPSRAPCQSRGTQEGTADRLGMASNGKSSGKEMFVPGTRPFLSKKQGKLEGTVFGENALGGNLD